MNKNKLASPTDRTTKSPSIRTSIRAGASEVFVCTVTVTDGKQGPVTCVKLGDMQ